MVLQLFADMYSMYNMYNILPYCSGIATGCKYDNKYNIVHNIMCYNVHIVTDVQYQAIEQFLLYAILVLCAIL